RDVQRWRVGRSNFFTRIARHRLSRRLNQPTRHSRCAGLLLLSRHQRDLPDEIVRRIGNDEVPFSVERDASQVTEACLFTEAISEARFTARYCRPILFRAYPPDV